MKNESITDSDVEVFMGAIISTIPITEMGFAKYHTGQLNDPICIRVKQYCTSGWPAKQNFGAELIPYWRDLIGLFRVVYIIFLSGCNSKQAVSD